MQLTWKVFQLSASTYTRVSSSTVPLYNLPDDDDDGQIDKVVEILPGQVLQIISFGITSLDPWIITFPVFY